MNLFRKLRTILIWLFALLFLLAVGVFLFAGWEKSNAILYPPKVPVPDSEKRIVENPADYGLLVSPFGVTHADGSVSRAAMVSALPEKEAGLAVKQRRMRDILSQRKNLPLKTAGKKRGTIILSHDLSGSMENMFRVAEYLTAAEFDCIIYDLRGHGRRTEETCTYGQEEKKEVAEVIAAAVAQFGDLGSIGVYGEGLGAAVVLQATAEVPEIRCVVSLDSFTTLKDEVWHELTKQYTKVPAYANYLTGDQILSWRMGFRCFDLAPVAGASRITVPSMVVSTNKTDPFYSECTQKIYEALASKDKMLYVPFETKDAQEYPYEEDELFCLVVEWFARHTHPPLPEVFVPVRRVPPPRKN